MNKVLLIDDSDAEHFLYRHILETYSPDIEILDAYDGQEALDILNKHPNAMFDYIFVDVNMPGMNGFEFLEAYKEKFDIIHQNIVMMTSSNRDGDRQKAQSYEHVKDYIIKPLSLEHLEKLVST